MREQPPPVGQTVPGGNTLRSEQPHLIRDFATNRARPTLFSKLSATA